MVKLYSTHCPKCRVLEAKLKQKNIDYTEETDIEIMKSMGMMSMPMLEVDGQLMNFETANQYINNITKG